MIAELCDLLPVRTMTPAERERENALVKTEIAAAVRQEARAVAPFLTVKGRTGREVAWAHVPWVGVHDPRIDAGARTGVFAACLFRVDGSGVVLSLQVGSASRTREELARDVEAVRAPVTVPDGFSAEAPVLVPEALRPDYDRGLAPYRYERASVIACSHPRTTFDGSGLPDQFLASVRRLLAAYVDWADRAAR